MAGFPVPDEQLVVSASGHEDVLSTEGDRHLADEVFVSEAEALDDVGLWDVARHADVFVPVGCEDIFPSLGLCDDERREHGHVA